MKCTHCGIALASPAAICPFCLKRQETGDRKIHCRDLGPAADMPCPECSTALSVVEFETQPPLTLERCGSCDGMFFNPGELEALMAAHGNPSAAMDPVELGRITAAFHQPRAVLYRKCPACGERMNHLNFGSSGVVLDRCGSHGVWVDGGTVRHLLEWWGAGGGQLYQRSLAGRARRIRLAPEEPHVAKRAESDPSWGAGSTIGDTWVLVDVLGVIASIVWD